MPATNTTTHFCDTVPEDSEVNIVVHTTGRRAGLLELTIPKSHFRHLPARFLNNIRDYVELIVPTETGVLTAFAATLNRNGLQVSFYSSSIALADTWPIAAVLILDPVIFGVGAIAVSMQPVSAACQTSGVPGPCIDTTRPSRARASVKRSTSQTGRKRKKSAGKQRGTSQSYETAVTAAGYSAIVGMVLSLLV